MPLMAMLPWVPRLAVVMLVAVWRRCRLALWPPPIPSGPTTLTAVLTMIVASVAITITELAGIARWHLVVIRPQFTQRVTVVAVVCPVRHISPDIPGTGIRGWFQIAAAILPSCMGLQEARPAFTVRATTTSDQVDRLRIVEITPAHQVIRIAPLRVDRRRTVEVALIARVHRARPASQLTNRRAAHPVIRPLGQLPGTKTRQAAHDQPQV